MKEVVKTIIETSIIVVAIIFILEYKNGKILNKILNKTR